MNLRPSRSYVKPVPIVTTYEPQLPDGASAKRRSVAGSTRAPSYKRAPSRAASIDNEAAQKPMSPRREASKAGSVHSNTYAADMGPNGYDNQPPRPVSRTPLHATATLTRLGLLELALQPEDLLLVNLSLSSVSKSFKEAIRGIIVESPCRMADLYLVPRPLRSLPTISKVLHELYLLVLNPPLVIVPSLNSWQSMKARVIISRKMVGILERVSSVGTVQS